MKIAILSPIAWRTPPVHYGPWEQIASNVTEGLVRRGMDVTLFATKNSITGAKLKAVCSSGYEEDRSLDAKVQECMHISMLMEHAEHFDIIHNHYDFHPLVFSRLISTPMVTTIHGFSSEHILPVFQRYNRNTHYVSISEADRHPTLQYESTVYNGIDPAQMLYGDTPGDYLLFFGRLHPDKGPHDAIKIAKRCGKRLIIAGIIQHKEYFAQQVEPFIDGDQIQYVGSAQPPERRKLMSEALALLHPIYFNEPFGLSVAESMMCGTPVIAYNRGSMPELIKVGETGFIVSNAAEAAEAVKDIPSISRRQCREWAESKFSVEKMVDGYVEAYKAILEKYPRGSKYKDLPFRN